MGYRTNFKGQFELDKPLSAPHKAYLEQFNDTRRVRRDAERTALRPDPLRAAVGLPVGGEGGYFVGDAGLSTRAVASDVVLGKDNPPTGQPGLWCQWRPTEDGAGIEWDGVEKFYAYTEWLRYLVDHFLAPWGYVLNGEVKWDGEDRGDLGVIVVVDNVVTTREGV